MLVRGEVGFLGKCSGGILTPSQKNQYLLDLGGLVCQYYHYGELGTV